MDITLTYGGCDLTFGGSNLAYFDPLNPLGLPPLTMRLRYEQGVTPSVSPLKGAITLVDSAQNIWDYTQQDAPQYPTEWIGLPEESHVLEVLGFNSTGVTDMMALFSDCDNLTSIPLFDTSSVTDMTAMFDRCTSLVTVPLYDTSSVTSMRHMFLDCTSLTHVPLFDTSSVTNMVGMFQDCSSLTAVPFFDTSSVTYMGGMFAACSNLTTIPLFNTSHVTSMAEMCFGCSSLTSIPLFDTSAVTDMYHMCKNCVSVQNGALALYTQASSQTTPPSRYYECFLNCGSNTQTGAQELAQIPQRWGGTASS